MNDAFQQLMIEATRLTRDGRLDEATRAIQRALGGAHEPARSPANPWARADAATDVIDGCVTEVDERDAAARRDGVAGFDAGATTHARATADTGPRPDAGPGTTTDARARTDNGDAADAAPLGDPGPVAGGGERGTFVAGHHAHGSMARDYKLFVPPGPARRGMALVVMLHGCTQDPDDFAAGTAMNERAREQGFLVLYPAQSRRANAQGCWNWFKHTHQQRHRGEPALIASMTRAIVERHGIDPARVYIAGLSAGGAMAATVASCFPELYAAVGVHSGLAPGAAGTLPEALAAMRGDAGGPLAAPARAAGPSITVPTIVFHGDQDHTVHASNGERVIDSAVHGAPARSEQGKSDQGRRYTRRMHAGDGAIPDTEHWIVHGAGHAWSGGSRAGSYTDPTGPDATGEMLRFFFAHHGHAGR